MLPLDVVGGTFTDRKLQPHQPEDWLCPEKWEVGHYVDSTYLFEWIERVVDNQTEILTRGHRDRIAAGEIDERPLESSLALVKPASLRLYVDETPWGPKKRAAFTVGGVADSAGTAIEFDLGMTDPVWRTRLASTYLNEITVLGQTGEPGQVYITISVGELHQNAYFKLVAAVITHDELAAASGRAALLPAE